MRVLFLGSPEFAVQVAEALFQGGYQVVGVVTQPDRPAGRGRRPAPTPVKTWAGLHGVPVLQPASLRSPEAAARLSALSPDVLVVAAYGRILPATVLEMAPLGCLNLHPSLLPRHRGPSPVAEAILQGDGRTGVTVMLLDEGMDTGPVLAQEEEPVRPDDTSESLTRRLFERGAGLMVRTLEAWGRGAITPAPQDHQRATYSRRLTREDGEMEFHLPAAALLARVRAFHPWPGTFTRWRGQTLKVLGAVALPGEAASGGVEGGQPGLVVRVAPGWGTPIAAVSGQGLLGLLSLQLEGRRAVDAEEFIRGHPSIVGSVLPG